MGYTPPEDAEKSKLSTPKLPKPKIGDVVLYYDIDGGDAQGQTLVGKISLIQPIAGGGDSLGKNKWLVEITEMEDVGDGYYAEYPSRKRRKSALRKLEYIQPLAASFVRGEDAYKVPMERSTNKPMAVQNYDLIGYEGPMATPINTEVVQKDGENYSNIKMELIKNAAIAGVAGTLLAQLLKGTDDAIIYAAGAAAGVAYLFFLGIKTDTVGSPDAKLGSNISNLRFVFPALVLVGVALNNVSSPNNPVVSPGMFSMVTPEQFGSAMIGFLTYRVPLFVSQLFPVIGESATDLLPGSAGMAVRMAQEAKKRGVDVSSLEEKADDGLVPVLMVSGPVSTGKTTLVNRLLEEDDRFVRPVWSDRVVEGMKFERREDRGEFLDMDETRRYGLTKEGILQAATKGKAVAIDADVPLAKKLVNLSGARIVGVWVGLDSLEKFESRFKAKLESGTMVIPEGETEDSVFRAKENQIVKDIEFGVVSGVFDFTILNDDLEESVKDLKKAASYCFK
jgi:guanylate kinase